MNIVQAELFLLIHYYMSPFPSDFKRKENENIFVGYCNWPWAQTHNWASSEGGNLGEQTKDEWVTPFLRLKH